MKWSLLELRKYQEEPLTFSQTIDLKDNMIKREPSILDIEPVLVEGILTVSKQEYILHYTAKTTITLPSTRSLTPVALPLAFSVDEVFMTTEQYARRNDMIPEEDIIILENDTLNLQESIEDNILLAIPTRVLTEAEATSDELPEGDGWKVISEEEYQYQQQQEAAETIDPRLAKLSELFQDTEDSDDR